MSTAKLPEAVALVMAKAPVPGAVKTRLGAAVGMQRAAELAAAALLDTMQTCVRAFGRPRCHLALTGDLSRSARADELLETAQGWSVHAQRGRDFATRLRHAHEDVAAAAAAPVVQVGMDTPHLSVELLHSARRALRRSDDAVLGPAYDGGWWLLGVGSAALVAGLADVPMSTPHTCAATEESLRRAGGRVRLLAELCDVDDVSDAVRVAHEAPSTRFARAWSEAGAAS